MLNSIADNHDIFFPVEFNPEGVLKDVYGNDVELVVRSGEYSMVKILADKVGVFTFRCASFCGAGHFGMFGSILVIPSSSETSSPGLEISFNFLNTRY